MRGGFVSNVGQPKSNTSQKKSVDLSLYGAQVKLWDVSIQQPALVATQDLQVGAVFGAAVCPEAPWLLAAGGAMSTVAVWDITTNSAVMSKYGRKLSRAVAAAHGDAAEDTSDDKN